MSSKRLALLLLITLLGLVNFAVANNYSVIGSTSDIDSTSGIDSTLDIDNSPNINKAPGIQSSLQSDERAGLTDLERTPESCIQRLENSEHTNYPASYTLPDKLSLISWNIYKAQRQELSADLNKLNEKADIVLLQEALLDKKLVDLKPFWRFAPGYLNGSQQSGVLTLSRWPATIHCHFVHTEPWLRTPKATNVVEYVLNDGRRLLAVNLHAINFSFGLTDYRRQLDDTVEIIKRHKGPVVFAGDLNSWSLRRGKLLADRLKSVGLTETAFTKDNRTRFLGRPLDHVWVRGIEVEHTEVPVYSSSDHNPLLVSFNFGSAKNLHPAPLSTDAVAQLEPRKPTDSIRSIIGTTGIISTTGMISTTGTLGTTGALNVAQH